MTILVTVREILESSCTFAWEEFCQENKIDIETAKEKLDLDEVFEISPKQADRWELFNGEA